MVKFLTNFGNHKNRYLNSEFHFSQVSISLSSRCCPIVSRLTVDLDSWKLKRREFWKENQNINNFAGQKRVNFVIKHFVYKKNTKCSAKKSIWHEILCPFVSASRGCFYAENLCIFTNQTLWERAELFLSANSIASDHKKQFVWMCSCSQLISIKVDSRRKKTRKFAIKSPR